MAATRADVSRRLRQAGRTRPVLRAGGGASGLRQPSDLAWLLPGFDATAPGPATEREALSLPPFGRAVDLIASAVAGTTLHAVRWDPDLGVSVRLPRQPSIVTKPNPLTPTWHHRYAATNDLTVFGNHFALPGDPDPDTDRPGWLVPIPVDDVWVVTDPTTNLWQWALSGTLLQPHELIHVSAGNRSGEVLGRGLLDQYRTWLAGPVAAERHSAAYFAGGALPPAVISGDYVLTQDQANELKSKWRALTRTREPVVLPRGITLTPVVSDADKAQLVEARRWNADLVAMLTGIPAYKLNLPGPTMTYQNVETADIDWVRDTVSRWADPYAATISDSLLPDDITARWDWSSRMRADQRTTADVLATLVDAKIITVDEARATIGRPPIAASITAGTTPAGVPELTPQEML